MPNQELISKIKIVERIASVSKFKRMMMNPFKYFNAIFFREIVYKKSKKEKEVVSNTFFDIKMHLLLPSSTDIYLTGGKSHDSEIRLAKFLMKQLDKNDTFLDIGAHYGYFSLLASKLVGANGKIYTFEASPTTFGILQKNCKSIENLSYNNRAVSDSNAYLIFYEFPNLYSEYNSIDIEQFKNEKWFSENKPKEVKIESIVMDDFLLKENINPKIIKIDVEGAEFKVINGLIQHLSKKSPSVVLEFLSDNRGNAEHIKAEKVLQSLGFQSYIIDAMGELQHVVSISEYMKNKGLESDNVVFVKSRNGN